MSETVAPQRYWNRVTDGSGRWSRGDERPPGEDLAALRQGAGREPGTVPSMWSFHTPVGDNWLQRHHEGWATPPEFQAEHHALVLYGFHQQTLAEPMHVEGIGLGTAMLRLRQHRDSGEQAIDRRFSAGVTAATLNELTQHLRRLVIMLRGISQPLDYTRLYKQFVAWQRPNGQGRVRRTWGLEYYASPRPQDEEDAATQAAAQ